MKHRSRVPGAASRSIRPKASPDALANPGGVVASRRDPKNRCPSTGCCWRDHLRGTPREDRSIKFSATAKEAITDVRTLTDDAKPEKGFLLLAPPFDHIFRVSCHAFSW